MDKLLAKCQEFVRLHAENISKEDIEDLAVELWIKLRDKDVGNAYIRKSAKNILIDFSRTVAQKNKRKVHSYNVDVKDTEKLEHEFDSRDVESSFFEAYDAYESALGRVRPEYEAVLRCAVAGMSMREMAEYLGLTEATVKTRLCRARKEIQEMYPNGNLM